MPRLGRCGLVRGPGRRPLRTAGDRNWVDRGAGVYHRGPPVWLVAVVEGEGLGAAGTRDEVCTLDAPGRRGDERPDRRGQCGFGQGAIARREARWGVAGGDAALPVDWTGRKW